jgi:hypothetical protein
VESLLHVQDLEPSKSGRASGDTSHVQKPWRKKVFNFWRKKSQLEKAIKKDGIEHTTDRVFEIIVAKIPTQEIAYRFILEEIDGASMGNDASIRFAKDSGISVAEYKGALDNSFPEVDGPDGPQQLLAGFAMHLFGNRELMAEFRCKVDDKIMKHFRLGKYSNPERSIQTMDSLPLTKDAKLKEIAKCLIDLTFESLCQINLELSQGNASSMLQSISDEFDDEAVAYNDSMFIALQVMEYLANNSLENKEYDALCMFAISIVSGTESYSENKKLSQEKVLFIGKMKSNAIELLTENKQFVNSSAARNFIVSFMLER